MHLIIFLTVWFLAAPSFAQGVDWDKIGRPMGNDTVDVYDRYVYFDETKVADPNVSLAEPILSRQSVGFWVQATLSELMTLTAQNYRGEINGRKNFFTAKGMKNYITFLGEQGLLDDLEKGHNLTTVVEFTPDILADAEMNGVYRWNIDVPLMISYKNATQESKKVTVNADLVRVPFGQNADGLAFDHWAVKQDPNVENEAEETPIDQEGEQNIVDDLNEGP